ncbi:MAG: bacterial transcriptional activator domain-containing protein [Candidatus Dormibacteraeota bacterium]|nr:bacterial transcriptional activator domain-containing protein [Candidatus Dormibacteraeota bacterium]
MRDEPDEAARIDRYPPSARGTARGRRFPSTAGGWLPARRRRRPGGVGGGIPAPTWPLGPARSASETGAGGGHPLAGRHRGSGPCQLAVCPLAALRSSVRVDLQESQALAHRLLDAVDQPLEAADLSGAAIAALSGELLPDWYEDWVLLEAEDWRQLRLHALEVLAGLLAAAGRYGDAAAAALQAVRADPLRESAHDALIRVHLAEHNRSEALREFKHYQELLRAELDIEPTAQLRDLVEPPGDDVTPR